MGLNAVKLRRAIRRHRFGSPTAGGCVLGVSGFGAPVKPKPRAHRAFGCSRRGVFHAAGLAFGEPSKQEASATAPKSKRETLIS